MAKQQSKQKSEFQAIDQHQNLGDLVQHFPIRHRKLKRWFWLVAGFISILMALIFTVFFFFEIRSAVDTHGRAIILNRLPLPLSLIFMASLLGIIMLFAAKFYNDNGITLYSKGFVFHQGAKNKIWIWEEVESLDTRITQVKFGGSLIALQTKIHLEDPQDRQCIIDHRYDQIEELTNQIRRVALPILIKKAQQQFNQDKTIKFHKNLKAVKSGLKTKDSLIGWDVIEPPIIKKRLIKLNSLSDEKIFFMSKVNKVKNLDLLINLIKNPPANND